MSNHRSSTTGSLPSPHPPLSSRRGTTSPTAPSPPHMPRDNQQEIKVDRLRREMDDCGQHFRELTHRIRSEKPYNATTRVFDDWAAKLMQIQHRSEDIFESLRQTALNPPVPVNKQASATISPLTSFTAGSGKLRQSIGDIAMKAMKDKERSASEKRKQSMASTANSRRKSSVTPRNGSPTKPSPRRPTTQQQQRSKGGQDVVLPSALQTSPPSSPFLDTLHHHGQQPPKLQAHFFQESAAGSYLVHATNPEQSRKLHALSQTLTGFLDGTMRAVRAEKAAIFTPHNKDIKDLKAVSATGFGPDCLLGDLRVHGEHTPQSLCLKTGLMIVVHRGLNPATTSATTAAADAIQRLKKAASGEPQDAPEHPTATIDGQPLPPSIIAAMEQTPALDAATNKAQRQQLKGTGSTVPGNQSFRSKYWSVICTPIRRCEAEAPIGVLCLYNKNFGRSNFDYEDEHTAYSAAFIACSMLQRCGSMDQLASCYEPQLNLPAVSSAAQQREHDDLLPGCRNQLIFRTWNPANGKEVRILSADDTQSVKLDEHTPVTNVSEYILKMQQAWKESVMLNLEFRKSHNSRTRYIANLLQRACIAEYKNTVLQQERSEKINIDDKERLKLRRAILGEDADQISRKEEEAIIAQLTEKVQQATSSQGHDALHLGDEENELDSDCDLEVQVAERWKTPKKQRSWTVDVQTGSTVPPMKKDDDVGSTTTPPSDSTAKDGPNVDKKPLVVNVKEEEDISEHSGDMGSLLTPLPQPRRASLNAKGDKLPLPTGQNATHDPTPPGYSPGSVNSAPLTSILRLDSMVGTSGSTSNKATTHPLSIHDVVSATGESKRREVGVQVAISPRSQMQQQLQSLNISGNFAMDGIVGTPTSRKGDGSVSVSGKSVSLSAHPVTEVPPPQYSEDTEKNISASVMTAEPDEGGAITSLFDIKSTHHFDESIAGTHPQNRSTTSIGGSSVRSTSHSQLRTSVPFGKMDKKQRDEALKSKHKYRIGNVIGQGAHGVVFSALLEDTGESVVAKQVCFNTEDPGWEDKLRAVQAEIQVLKKIEHDNIIQYYFTDRAAQVGKTDSQSMPSIFIFMEHASGGSLAHTIEQFGALSEKTVALFAAQMLIGLEHLHEHNIIHRDIKPANCLLSAFGMVKLADFGTAVITESDAATGLNESFEGVGPQGTPFYMAPEIIRGEEATPKADIWSLGATIMEMVTGQHPWTHLDTDAAGALRKIAVDGGALQVLPEKGEWSSNLQLFLQMCLNKNPDDRPTCTQLLRHPWFAGFDILALSANDHRTDSFSLRPDAYQQITHELASSVSVKPICVAQKTGLMQSITTASPQSSGNNSEKAKKKDTSSDDDKSPPLGQGEKPPLAFHL